MRTTITVVLLLITAGINAQGVKKSQTIINEITPKEITISYRMMIDAAGEIGNGVGGQFNLVPIGIQINPHLLIGLGGGISFINKKSPGMDSFTDWDYRYDQPHSTYERNHVYTDFDAKHEGNMSFFPYIMCRINLQKDKPIIPFIQMAVGPLFSEDEIAFYGHFRVGATRLSSSKRTGVSVFAGASLASANSSRFSATRTVNYEGRSYTTGAWVGASRSEYSYGNSDESVPITVSVGVSFEFGGSAGLKVRKLR